MPTKPSLVQRLKWKNEYLGYLFAEGVLRLLSPTGVDRLGRGVGRILYYLSPSLKIRVRRNLRIAFGKELSPSDIDSMVRTTCERNITNFLAAVKTATLTSDEAFSCVSLEGFEEVRKILETGSGAILLLGHLGNWEMLNRLHQILPPGGQAGGIYQPLKNPHVDRRIYKQRTQDGSQLFSKRDGFHRPAQFVKEGGLLIVVGDQKVTNQGSVVPFFNRLSSLSTLPSILARKAKVPVFTVGIHTTAPARWKFVFKALAKGASLTEQMAQLEAHIRVSPCDYLWFHNRWKLTRSFPLSFNTRRLANLPSDTIPLRLLIISTDSQLNLPELSKQLSSTARVQDLPLKLETLIITEQPCEETSGKNTNYLVSPTKEQVMNTIRDLDSSQPHPMEGIILAEPNSDWLWAAKCSEVPFRTVNQTRLPLVEYISSLRSPEK